MGMSFCERLLVKGFCGWRFACRASSPTVPSEPPFDWLHVHRTATSPTNSNWISCHGLSRGHCARSFTLTRGTGMNWDEISKMQENLGRRCSSWTCSTLASILFSKCITSGRKQSFHHPSRMRERPLKRNGAWGAETIDAWHERNTQSVEAAIIWVCGLREFSQVFCRK